MEQISLRCQLGGSDKVYNASIEPDGELFVVNFSYGRFGSALKAGTKTSSPVDYDKAKKVFESLVKSKAGKGYEPFGEEAKTFQLVQTPERSEHIPQLLNEIESETALSLIRNSTHLMQIKMDGVRLIIEKIGDQVRGINKKGLYTSLSEELVESYRYLTYDLVVDGELVGDTHHVFDITSYRGKSTKENNCLTRYSQLIALDEFDSSPFIEVVKAYITPEEKMAAYSKFIKENEEGAVFKNIYSTYVSGRPSSGGDQLKNKFYATASFVVSKINDGKRSVAISLLEDIKVVPAGNVTIPVNHDIPSIGDVVEVRYLYAFKESGSVYQPVYKGKRYDVDAEECLVSQLKYKAAA